MIQEGLLCKELEVLEVRPIPGSPVAHLFLEPLNLPFTPGQFVMLRPKLWEYDPYGLGLFPFATLTLSICRYFFR